MGRILFILLAVGAALWWLRGRIAGRAQPPRSPGPPPSPPAPQAMVACAHCGVHLPRGDAVFDPQGRPYCSSAHQLAGPRA